MTPLAEVFVQLFRGRGDAFGTWVGGAVRERVTPEMFERHLLSTNSEDWFGVYNVIGERCSWGCVDIDTDDVVLAYNIQGALNHQEIPAWIEKTTRGYHIWVFPDQPLMSAIAMRLALTAACLAVGYRPKEVFPKQTRVVGAQLGNYVRLPLNGALAGHPETRRFLDGVTIRKMDEDRAHYWDLERVASYAPRMRHPQTVDISVDFEAGVEYEEAVQQIGGLAYRIWARGPGDGHDRSTTLTELAHRLHEADVDPSMAYGIVNSADQRWGKRFADRGPQGQEILRRIVTNAYGRGRNDRGRPGDGMTGKRTGHPKKERTKGVCRSCGEPRFFKARRLCETCWVYAKGAGTLQEFPSVYDKKNERDTPGTFCRCYSPIVDPMPAWNTAQCLKCGREIRT